MDNSFSTGNWMSNGANPRLRKYMLSKAYSRNVWVYACVKVIAEAVASVPPVFSVGGNPAKDDSSLLNLFSPPADQQIPSFSELIKRTIILELVQCACHWVIKREKGIPTEVYLKRKNELTPVYDDDKNLIGWVELNKDKTSVKAAYRLGDIVTFSEFHPDSDDLSMSPILASRLEIETDFNMSAWTAAYLENGVSKDLVVESPDGMTKEQSIEAVNSILGSRKRGVDGSHGVLVLPFGIKLAPNVAGSAEKDIDFQNGKKGTKNAICAAFKVPPVFVSEYGEANYANSWQQRVILWEQAIVPRLKSIASLVNMQLIVPNFEGAELDWDWAFVRQHTTNIEQQAKAAKEYIDMGYSKNEISVILNAPELASDEKEEPKEDAEDVPEEPGEDAKSKTWDRDYAIAYTGILETLEGDWVKMFSSFTRAMKRSALRRVDLSMSPELNMIEWKTVFDQLAEPVIKKDWYTGASIAAEEAEVSGYKNLKTVNAPVNIFSKLTREDKEVLDSSLQLFITKRVSKIGTDAVAKFNSEVVPALYSGATNNELKDKIKEALRIQESHALYLTRGLSGAAYNQAKFIMMERRGVERHKWLDSNDKNVRDTHNEENGNEVELGASFPVTQLRFPHDPEGAINETANCRCTIVATVYGKIERPRPKIADDADLPEAVEDRATIDIVNNITEMPLYKQVFTEPIKKEKLKLLSVDNLSRILGWLKIQTLKQKAKEIIKFIGLDSVGKSAGTEKSAVYKWWENGYLGNPVTGRAIKILRQIGQPVGLLGYTPQIKTPGVVATIKSTTIKVDGKSVYVSGIDGLVGGQKGLRELWKRTLKQLPKDGLNAEFRKHFKLKSFVVIDGDEKSLLNTPVERGDYLDLPYMTGTHADIKWPGDVRFVFKLPDEMAWWKQNALIGKSRAGEGEQDSLNYPVALDNLTISGYWKAVRVSEYEEKKVVVFKSIKDRDFHKKAEDVHAPTLSGASIRKSHMKMREIKEWVKGNFETDKYKEIDKHNRVTAMINAYLSGDAL